MVVYSKPSEEDVIGIYNLLCNSIKSFDTLLLVSIRGTLSSSCIARESRTNELVGYVSLSSISKFKSVTSWLTKRLGVVSDWQEVAFLEVKCAYRKQGVGTQLLRLCLDSSNRNVMCIAWGDSTSAFAQRALKNNGFTLFKAIDGFLPKQGQCVECIYAGMCSGEDCYSYVYYKLFDKPNLVDSCLTRQSSEETNEATCFEVTCLPAEEAMKIV